MTGPLAPGSAWCGPALFPEERDVGIVLVGRLIGEDQFSVTAAVAKLWPCTATDGSDGRWVSIRLLPNSRRTGGQDTVREMTEAASRCRRGGRPDALVVAHGAREVEPRPHDFPLAVEQVAAHDGESTGS
jgi:hypothetical protein